MNKPTAYLPLYGNDFFEAISGYPDAVGMGYLRAIWHYWNHTGCEGLPDDDDYLRRICCCDPGQWEEVRAVLFDNRYHFRLIEGAWHQPRCRAEFDKSKAIYAKRSAAGKRAMAKRWQGAA